MGENEMSTGLNQGNEVRKEKHTQIDAKDLCGSAFRCTSMGEDSKMSTNGNQQNIARALLSLKLTRVCDTPSDPNINLTPFKRRRNFSFFSSPYFALEMPSLWIENVLLQFLIHAIVNVRDFIQLSHNTGQPVNRSATLAYEKFATVHCMHLMHLWFFSLFTVRCGFNTTPNYRRVGVGGGVWGQSLDLLLIGNKR